MSKGFIRNAKRGQVIIEYILSVIANILIASGIGHTLDMEKQMIVFSIFYTILRSSSGGNYLKLNTKNTVSIWGFGAAAIFGIEYILEGDYGRIVLLVFLIVSLLTVMVLAPFRIHKINIPEDIIKDLTKRSSITICLECLCLAVGIWTFNSNIVAAAIVGVFIQSMSLILIPIRQKQIVDFQLYNVN